MSYYQKYRPTDFADLIGNREELDAFRAALAKPAEDRPTAYLLTGPRGIGKTTAARIAARELGATVMSLREINSADNRGIDTAREIIDEMRLASLSGDARCYIIDEIHQCNTLWQNAMLKPLEDTPPRTYFFLCTTDPQRLIAPLRSRCHPVNLKALPVKLLYRLLFKVATKEGLTLSKDTLEEIAEAAQGSPRDALVLLEKVAGLYGPESTPTEAAVSRLLAQGVEEAEVINLCRGLLSGRSWGEIADLIKGLPEGTDPEAVRHAVIGYMNAVLLGGKENASAAVALESFAQPFYNTGRAGITLAAFQAFASRK